MKLSKYNNKRDFNNTTEPKGEKITKNNSINNKLRFVIQHHFARKEHYDLRFEFDGVLISFAVPKGLPIKEEDKFLAVHVEDHPLDYINFKGIIPKGNYGAGKVEIYDKGFYNTLINFEEGLKKGHLKVELKGKKYKGIYSLIRTKEPNWLIIKNKDTKNKIKNPFSIVEVKLAKLTSKIPLKNYLFEIKYDGYRIVSFCDKKVKLLTRNNKDYTSKFLEIVNSLNNLNKTMILDGEVVVFDKLGRSDFSLLQENIKNKNNNFVYVIFDILAFDGKDLRNLPLIERKKILEKNLVNMPSNLILSSYVLNKGKESFKLAKKLNLEGIVAKKIDSVYNSLRDEDWLKIKCYKRQEFVIGGYSVTDKNNLISAILVGYFNKKDFIFIGKVGTGLNDKLKQELNQKFKSLKRKTSPFKNLKKENVNWLTPKIVCEIQYAEITKSGVLRQPSFIGLRLDKNFKDVVLEEG